MARPLLSSCRHILCSLPAALITSNFLTLTVIFTVFSAVIFLCGGHAVRLGGEKMKKMKSSFSSKALSSMVSWRKVDSDEHAVDDNQDDVVWKKTIIRGDKCRPLDFSGRILYDAHGNLLSD